MKKIILTAVLLFSFQTAHAGECILKITRTACPGKEVEAFKPYDNKKTTQEKKVAATSSACQKMAEKEAKIVRKGTLSEKAVEASFDGTPIAASPEMNGKSACN